MNENSIYAFRNFVFTLKSCIGNTILVENNKFRKFALKFCFQTLFQANVFILKLISFPWDAQIMSTS